METEEKSHVLGKGKKMQSIRQRSVLCLSAQLENAPRHPLKDGRRASTKSVVQSRPNSAAELSRPESSVDYTLETQYQIKDRKRDKSKRLVRNPWDFTDDAARKDEDESTSEVISRNEGQGERLPDVGPESFRGSQAQRHESIAEYLHSKREVFMLEYMIRVKWQEAENLRRLETDELAKLSREEAKTRREEEQLEELIEKVGVEQRQVIAEAEEASRRRAECVAKIRALNGEIFRMKSEVEREGDVSKAREGYRKFLVSLSPRNAAQSRKNSAQLDDFGSPHGSGRSSPQTFTRSSGSRLESRLQRRQRSDSKSPDSGRFSVEKDYLSVSPRSASPGKISLRQDSLGTAFGDRIRSPEAVDMSCQKPEEVLNYVRTIKRQVLSLLGEMVALEDELVDVRERKDEIQQMYTTETKQAEAEKSKMRQSLEADGKTKAILEKAVFDYGNQWLKPTGFRLTEEYFRTLRRIYAQFYPETADLELSPIELLTKIEDVMQEVTDEVESMPTDVFVKAMKRQESEKQKREKEERQQKLKQMREERLRKKISFALAPRNWNFGKNN